MLAADAALAVPGAGRRGPGDEPASGLSSGQLDGQGDRERAVEHRRTGHPGRPEPVRWPRRCAGTATAARVASDADTRTASKCHGVNSRPIPAGTVACTIIEPEMFAMASRVLPCRAQITALSTSGSSVATGASSSATAAGGRPELGPGPLQLLHEQLRRDDHHDQRARVCSDHGPARRCAVAPPQPQRAPGRSARGPGRRRSQLAPDVERVPGEEDQPEPRLAGKATRPEQPAPAPRDDQEPGLVRATSRGRSTWANRRPGRPVPARPAAGARAGDAP